MGNWGYNALESDEGLDLIDALETYIDQKAQLNEKITLTLEELIHKLQEDGWLGKTTTEIEYLYDVIAIGLAEVYVNFKQTNKLFDDESAQKFKILSFSASKDALTELHKLLLDILEEKPDIDGIREYHLLWRESVSYDKWLAHLKNLITQLESELHL